VELTRNGIQVDVGQVTLLTQNGKIKDTGKRHGVRLYNFGIPAYQSKYTEKELKDSPAGHLPAFQSVTGIKTCPMAGECAKGCYAKQGAYTWSNVSSVFEARLQVTLRPDFAQIMINEVTRVRADIVRIHDSGDFYSLEYVLKWFAVMKALPNVRFYAYTKMVSLFKRLDAQDRIPANFTVIFSYGGLEDKLIDPTTDRHSVVFTDMRKLVELGYANTTEDDLQAIGTNHRIGLVYHGTKSKTWTSEERI
jgi:hypothetical protein